MMPYAWRMSLLKRGTAVLVNINYDNAPGIPARWALGTLVGHAQGARLSRIMFDDTRNHRAAPGDLRNNAFAGTTNVVASFRVKPAITRTAA